MFAEVKLGEKNKKIRFQYVQLQLCIVWKTVNHWVYFDAPEQNQTLDLSSAEFSVLMNCCMKIHQCSQYLIIKVLLKFFVINCDHQNDDFNIYYNSVSDK